MFSLGFGAAPAAIGTDAGGVVQHRQLPLSPGGVVPRRIPEGDHRCWGLGIVEQGLLDCAHRQLGGSQPTGNRQGRRCAGGLADVENQRLQARRKGEDIQEGVKRIIEGLFKKLVVANSIYNMSIAALNNNDLQMITIMPFLFSVCVYALYLCVCICFVCMCLCMYVCML
jgi:hypothetical protein